jgi:hypothetical protein
VIFGGDPESLEPYRRRKNKRETVRKAVRSKTGTRGTLIDATPSSANRLTRHL